MTAVNEEPQEVRRTYAANSTTVESYTAGTDRLTPQIFHVGVNYRTAPLGVRERLRCDLAREQALLARLAELASERMILSTCERFEVYALTDRPFLSDWLDELANALDMPLDLLTRHAYSLTGDAVAGHLLRVAAGLKSRILGEPQILGQVRQAFLQAGKLGTIAAVISALGRAALRTGKRVRHETTINQRVRSIATITVNRMEQELGGLRGKPVVIVGSGKLASDLAFHLAPRRAKLIVVSRNLDRALALARRFRGVGVVLNKLPEAISHAQAAIACTSAPEFIINEATFAGHSGWATAIWDLSVPRNVDPCVARLPGVRLTHLDELVAQEKHQSRGLSAVDRIVREEFERFSRWRRERRAAPQIAEVVRQTRDASVPARPVDRRLLHARIMLIKAEAAA